MYHQMLCKSYRYLGIILSLLGIFNIAHKDVIAKSISLNDADKITSWYPKLSCLVEMSFQYLFMPVNGHYEFNFSERRSIITGIMECFSWSPLDLSKKYQFNLGNYALIILNRPIVLPPNEMMSLWKEATIRSTVDGGTTRWFDFLKQHKIDVTFPDIVSGDFDSISPSLLNICEENGVYVEKTPDQNYTDFEKALYIIKQRCDKKLDSLLVLLDVSGRLDHTFSNLNTLHRTRSIFSDYHTKAYLLTSVSLTWILNPGQHTISIPSYIRDEEEWCGILPFTPVKNHITTTGLKWNLDKQTVEFGGLISSSNTYDGSPEVTLTTDAEIIWCMGYRKEN